MCVWLDLCVRVLPQQILAIGACLLASTPELVPSIERVGLSALASIVNLRGRATIGFAMPLLATVVAYNVGVGVGRLVG